MLQIVTDEAIVVNSHFKSHGTGFFYRRHAELLGKSEDALDAPDRELALILVQGAAEDADMRARLLGSP